MSNPVPTDADRSRAAQQDPDRRARDRSGSAAGGVDGRRCDFCGDVVASVRRVALDLDYDRLQKAHTEQYSCAPCFEAKERRRLGLARR